MNVFRFIAHAFFIFFTIACTAPKAAKPKVDLVIVQVNDIYEIGGVNQGKEGSLARVQGLVDSLKKAHTQVLLVHAGDFLNPSIFSNLKDSLGQKIKGKQMVDVMNTMSFDAVAFGNHELDLGYSDLQSRLNEMEFDMISANLFYKDSNKIRRFMQGSKEVKGYKSFEIKTDYGVKKLTILSVILPYNKKNYVYYQPVDSVLTHFIDSFQTISNGVFLLTHLGREHDRAIGQRQKTINLIMGGHDHYSFCDTIGKERYLTKADANARTAWVHFVNWDNDKQHFFSNSTLVSLNEKVRKNKTVESKIMYWEKFVKGKTAQMGYDLDNIILKLDTPLDAKEESIRSQQTNFGNLLCRAVAAQDNRVSMAIINAGSVRYDDLIINRLTEGDVLKALPFGGEVKGAYVTGRAIKRILEASDNNIGSGGYLQLLQLEKEMADDSTYFIITTEYMSSGREKNLSFLSNFEWEKPNKISSKENDLKKILINYCAAKSE